MIPTRVEEALNRLGLRYTAHVHPRALHTTEEVAAAVGLPANCLVKVMVLCERGGALVMALLPGHLRLHVPTASRALGLKLALARPAQVQQSTGYPLGAVPPLGWTTAPDHVLLEPALLGQARINVSAGDPRCSLDLAGDALERLWPGAHQASICRS